MAGYTIILLAWFVLVSAGQELGSSNTELPSTTGSAIDTTIDAKQPTIASDTTFSTTSETIIDTKGPTTIENTIDTKQPTITSDTTFSTTSETTIDTKSPTTIETTINPTTEIIKDTTTFNKSTIVTITVTDTKTTSTTEAAISSTITPAVPTAEEQCKSRGHVRRCSVPLCSVCYNLLCKSRTGSRAITGPAQDGTVCGYDSVCRQGECVYQPINTSIIGETIFCDMAAILINPFC